MNIYENNKELLSILGVEGNYNTDFEVRKAILNALGGDASICNSIYEVDLQILKIYQEGGGGTGGSDDVFVMVDGARLSCSNTEIIFKIDSSGVNNFSNMFENCSNLTYIPHIDTSNGTNFSYMFRNCSNLTTIPQLITSKGTRYTFMFDQCKMLTYIPYIDTSNGTDFAFMFNQCNMLTNITQLDISGGTNIVYIFAECRNLENITFVGSINDNIDFSPCTKLTYDSVKSILTACSNTTNTNAKTLKFSRTLTDQNGELQSLTDICTSKGWTISGLTLN